MLDHTALIPPYLKPAVSDGVNLKPSITTGEYQGRLPKSANDIKRSVIDADGILKSGVATDTALRDTLIKKDADGNPTFPPQFQSRIYDLWEVDDSGVLEDYTEFENNAILHSGRALDMTAGAIKSPIVPALSDDWEIGALFKGDSDKILFSWGGLSQGWLFERRSIDSRLLIKPGNSEVLFDPFPLSDIVWTAVSLKRIGASLGLYVNNSLWGQLPVTLDGASLNPLSFGGRLNESGNLSSSAYTGQIAAPYVRNLTTGEEWGLEYFQQGSGSAAGVPVIPDRGTYPPGFAALGAEELQDKVWFASNSLVAITLLPLQSNWDTSQPLSIAASFYCTESCDDRILDPHNPFYGLTFIPEVDGEWRMRFCVNGFGEGVNAAIWQVPDYRFQEHSVLLLWDGVNTAELIYDGASLGERVLSSPTLTNVGSIGRIANVGATGRFTGYIKDLRLNGNLINDGTGTTSADWGGAVISGSPQTIGDLRTLSYPPGEIIGTADFVGGIGMDEPFQKLGAYEDRMFSVEASDDGVSIPIDANFFSGGNTISCDLFYVAGTPGNRIFEGKSSTISHYVRVFYKTDGKITFRFAFTVSDAVWTSVDPVDLSSTKRFSVYYNSDSVTNDPIIQIDGVTLALTEDTAPVGSSLTSHGTLILGNNVSGTRAWGGVHSDWVVGTSEYIGHGNTDADWEDQVGSNDGTVNGSPATIADYRRQPPQMALRDFNQYRYCPSGGSVTYSMTEIAGETFKIFFEFSESECQVFQASDASRQILLAATCSKAGSPTDSVLVSLVDYSSSVVLLQGLIFTGLTEGQPCELNVSVAADALSMSIDLNGNTGSGTSTFSRLNSSEDLDEFVLGARNDGAFPYEGIIQNLLSPKEGTLSGGAANIQIPESTNPAPCYDITLGVLSGSPSRYTTQPTVLQYSQVDSFINPIVDPRGKLLNQIEGETSAVIPDDDSLNASPAMTILFKADLTNPDDGADHNIIWRWGFSGVQKQFNIYHNDTSPGVVELRLSSDGTAVDGIANFTPVAGVAAYAMRIDGSQGLWKFGCFNESGWQDLAMSISSGPPATLGAPDRDIEIFHKMTPPKSWETYLSDSEVQRAARNVWRGR